ncbi:MAG TPA: hypothetical protein VI457_16835, partial [Methylococcaceae bacterium]|nr:hypothetical protein [Methylococcaceae bacterium]
MSRTRCLFPALRLLALLALNVLLGRLLLGAFTELARLFRRAGLLDGAAFGVLPALHVHALLLPLDVLLLALGALLSLTRLIHLPLLFDGAAFHFLLALHLPFALPLHFLLPLQFLLLALVAFPSLARLFFLPLLFEAA